MAPFRKKDKIRLMASGKEYEIDELGVLSPTQVQVDDLHAGEVGYLAASIKAVEDARVGDTITLVQTPAETPLPGYVEAKPMVFCGLFPTVSDQFEELREALEKLHLSDAALQYEPENLQRHGVWVPLWLLGAAAHGNCARTPGARIRPGPDYHGPIGNLPGD